MRMMVIAVPALLAALFSPPPALASEADELRERARLAKQEAVELKQQGRMEESEKLARKAKELALAAEKLDDGSAGGPERQIDQLRGHLKELLEKERHLRDRAAPKEDLAGVLDRIGEVRHTLAKLQEAGKERLRLDKQRERIEGLKEPLMAKLAEAGRRIEHMRIAAKHLHEAGAHDLAGQLMEKAGEIEREAGELKRNLAERMNRPPREEPREALAGELKALRGEVHKLRGELQELREHIRKLEDQRRIQRDPVP